jgi:hypothetical protein
MRQVLRFPPRRMLKLWISGLRHCIVLKVDTNVLADYATSIVTFEVTVFKSASCLCRQ